VHPDIDTDTIFGEDRADVAGNVVVNGNTVELDEIPGTDRPEWGIGRGNFRFEVPNDLIEVPIRINLFDVDGGLSGAADTLDISPDPTRTFLEFTFNRCSQRVSGDVNGVSSTILRSEGNAASGEALASITFRVSADEGITTTPNDLVLLDYDVIQVIPEVPRLVAGKPAVLYVRVANTSPNTWEVPIDVNISGPGGYLFTERTSLPEPIPPNSIKAFYLYRDRPLRIPNPTATERSLTVRVQIDPEGVVQKLTGQPEDLCRRQNDGVSIDDNQPPRWKIVQTRTLDVRYVSVDGTLIGPRFANIATVRRMSGIGTSYMKSVFPVPDVTTSVDPGTNNFIASAVSEFILNIFHVVGIPGDAARPFMMLFEMNIAYSIVGADKVVGVVHPHWFEQFIYGLWDEVAGVSLGPAGRYAVLAEAGRQLVPIVGGSITPPEGSNIYVDNEIGAPISMTLPAHEVGHTFGISADTDLKDVFCGMNSIFGQLACGISGGFDEYEHPVPSRRAGNATRGFWIKRGDEAAEVASLADREYCASRCLMGSGTNGGEYMRWDAEHRLIDRVDYQHLIDKLAIVPDPETISVAGAIADDGTNLMYPFFINKQGIPSLTTESRGVYTWRFLDEKNKVLQSISMEANFALSELPVRPPVMLFTHTLSWVRGTKKIELFNTLTNKVIFTRKVSPSAPKVSFTNRSSRRPQSAGPRKSFLVQWQGTDDDGSRGLSYLPMLSEDRKRWWPMGSVTKQRRIRYQADNLAPGLYFMRVFVSDGVNTSSSETITLRVLDK